MGVPAGCYQPHGYWTITVQGHKYYLHRLAWFYMTGEWPENDIDHIDGVRSNNRFSNLRECTRSQNLRNKASPTGVVPGVNFNKALGKWGARIHEKRKVIHLGTFATFEEAVAIRKQAEQQHYEGFAPRAT